MKLRTTAAVACLFILTGCQINYIMKSGYGQFKLMSARQPVEEILKQSDLSEDKRRKLELSQEAKKYAEEVLHLKPTKNYNSYVELPSPYVTYVVSAAPKWSLEHYQWSYPFLGKMPYKGYFDEKDAQKEELLLKEQNLDTYLRGVSAYSTLGWFADPLLSSMLRYKDYDLVNTVIHETVHATLYIKHAADFNERLATFLGNKGAEYFYKDKEGENSPTLQAVRSENHDNRIFSEFISAEILELKNWYKNLEPAQQIEEARLARIRNIQDRFIQNIKPQLKSDQYRKFPELSLNNARLLIYKTYMQNLSEFEELFDLLQQDFQQFIQVCKKLEKEKDPEKALKKVITEIRTQNTTKI